MAAYLVWADDFQLVSDPSQRHDSRLQFVQEPGDSRASRGLVDRFAIRSQAAKRREQSRREARRLRRNLSEPSGNGLISSKKERDSSTELLVIQQSRPAALAHLDGPSSRLADSAASRDALKNAISLMDVGVDSNHNSQHELLNYRGDLLRMIRWQLTMMPGPDSDSIIANIASLVVFEGLNGDVGLSRVHICGLESLVGTRTNAKYSPLDKTLQKLVTWAALYHGVLSQHMPKPFLLRIDGDEICRGLDLPDTEVVSALQDHEDAMQAIIQNQDLSRESTTIFCYLRRLSKFHGECAASGEATELFELLEHVESQTARLLLAVSQDLDNPICRIMILFALAANIYIYAVLRGIPLSVQYYSVMATRLWSATQNVNFEALGAVFAKKSLWILYVGRLAANGRPEQKLFERRLREVGRFCGLDGEDTRRFVFRQMLWPRMKNETENWADTFISMRIMEF